MSCIVAMLLALFAAADAPLTVWAVDPLVNVFQDALPQRRTEALAEVAQGEHASLQVVVRSDAAIAGLRAEAPPLALEGGSATLEPRAPRYVGYVPIEKETTSPASDQLRKPPAWFPDPLLEEESLDVAAGNAQPVWITVRVPVDAAPGVYRGSLRLSGTVDGAEAAATFPLAIRVYPVTVENTRLWVSNWFSITSRGLDIDAKPGTEEYEALFRRYARNMADHRQNVAIVSVLGHTDITPREDGTLAFDFSRFDEEVRLLIEEGVIGRIEGGHIGHRSGRWTSHFVVRICQVKDGKVVGSSVDAKSPAADAFYSQFMPALVAHLKERGWLEYYMQHVADEPIIPNADSYRAIADLVHKYAPEIRTMDASHAASLTGAIDIWVPQIDYLHKDFIHYQARQRAGDEVWMYTCVTPQGEYANRFIELPLMKTRLLHWVNFRSGTTGYLHWGYNKWRGDPFKDMTPPFWARDHLPAGDAWIVYPGKDGPLDSIRFEAMRDGIVDHELLCMLAGHDLAGAHELAARHILDFDRYNTDVERFRATRRRLLEQLSEL
ncbi:MAG: DUF4091 domain-containing protein [Candidatus Hydrogenedentes bacterium]|nr:DUF4091 domain-containing protein [Candidatus Hydrogenedentota bacterium]